MDGRFCYNEVLNDRSWDIKEEECIEEGNVWISEYYVEPNEAGSEDCLEVWGFDKYLNDAPCKSRGWMGFVVEYELNGSNLYLSLIHICRCRRRLRCSSRWSPYQ